MRTQITCKPGSEPGTPAGAGKAAAHSHVAQAQKGTNPHKRMNGVVLRRSWSTTLQSASRARDAVTSAAAGNAYAI